MKKIPTLYKRVYDEHGKVSAVLPEISEGIGFGIEEMIPTVKLDGTCCAVIGGELYRRYDAKRGKNPPEGAIPCEFEPDPVTGHWPHWVKVSDDPADKHHRKAFENWKFAMGSAPTDGTYELIGRHFQGNPYNLSYDILVRHGRQEAELSERSFEGVMQWMTEHNEEGIVFWDPTRSYPVCKIKRKDFGLDWPVKRGGV